MHNEQRRAILINGAAYRRQQAAVESHQSFLQSLCSALSLAVFVVGGLMMIVALSGCASSNLNTTYNLEPIDYQGRQTPHSVP